MKTLNYKRVTRYFGYILLCTVLLISCDGMSPKFGDKSEPFVVTEIKIQTNGMCRYYGFSNGMMQDYFEADKGLFNIGDTVRVCK